MPLALYQLDERGMQAVERSHYLLLHPSKRCRKFFYKFFDTSGRFRSTVFPWHKLLVSLGCQSDHPGCRVRSVSRSPTRRAVGFSNSVPSRPGW